ncbi:TPA: hypothetical protein ACSQIM_001214 [Clostridium perfringens]|uniref:Uncharacterized protein n=1 Tax=Clostridium perfringens TaxID=1502 RepID=A0AAW4IZK5_CLOPF|nr:hypothetical protein [Clostridium perfringens]STB12151.1 Uncharacterised protein [Clostridium novyi]EHA6440349.1 hypothetical protein [Clostridium perfringens]EHP49781.1 hypothetical protein HMPREF9476_00789 [Clostridium perfringens WAL-14572]EJT6475245.1 hypothetical protein [Clostridium perfringens]EJT6480053.1 hypothetical protein [Clostridium perfringens]
MSKKVFKKREDIEEVGLLLKIANAALTRACTKVSNNIGNSNTVTKSLNKLEDDLNKLRSDMDNKINGELIDKELLKSFNEKELNNIFYGQGYLLDKALENLNR